MRSLLIAAALFAATPAFADDTDCPPVGECPPLLLKSQCRLCTRAATSELSSCDGDWLACTVGCPPDGPDRRECLLICKIEFWICQLLARWDWCDCIGRPLDGAEFLWYLLDTFPDDGSR